MIFVCSVVLADKAFTLQFAGKMLSLSAGDVLLIDDTDREDFQPHAAHITVDWPPESPDNQYHLNK
ncbi:hypothetical protein LAW48_23535 [Escherichia coli]|nr:hypothetical protein [Escherichia coli]